jgi:hypothetical protein
MLGTVMMTSKSNNTINISSNNYHPIPLDNNNQNLNNVNIEQSSMTASFNGRIATPSLASASLSTIAANSHLCNTNNNNNSVSMTANNRNAGTIQQINTISHYISNNYQQQHESNVGINTYITSDQEMNVSCAIASNGVDRIMPPIIQHNNGSLNKNKQTTQPQQQTQTHHNQQHQPTTNNR